MNLEETRYPLVKLPSDEQMILFLIREELKISKVFNTLEDLGFVDSGLRPNLDSLIRRIMGLYDLDDETFEFYMHLMEKRASKITEDPNSITKQAMKAYMELCRMKKELDAKSKKPQR